MAASRRPGEAPPPLRVAVQLDGLRAPAWVRALLREIRASDLAELALVVLGGTPEPPPRLLRAYETLDRRLFRVADDPLELVDVSADLDGVPRVGPGEPLGAAGLDVALDLGSGPARPDLPAAARYGVWCFDQGSPPGFWPVFRGDPVSPSLLRARGPEGSSVLDRAWSATDATSLHRGRTAVLRKAGARLLRALRDPERAPPAAPPADPEPLHARPSTGAVLAHVGRVVYRLLRNRVSNRLYRTQWVVGVRELRGDAIAPLAPEALAVIRPPPERFYADPFPIEHGGCRYVFFEDYPYAEGKGVISFCEIDAEGAPGPPERVLERPYHLSYPHVFTWSGDVWMLPETERNRTVELYRAREFPRRWERERVLLDDVAAVDATLFRDDEGFWLFTGLAATGGSLDDELHLFFADSPLGPWTPHPRNPLVCDVRRARPAGPLFRRGGELLRPAQDCSVEYGHALVLHRVEVLSRSDYREVPVERIGPGWWPGARGTHTLSRSATLEAVDVKLRVRRRPV